MKQLLLATTILAAPVLAHADCGAAGSLDYAISGLSSGGNSILLQQPNGTFDIIVWSEGNAATVTLNLGNVSAVKLYDPTQSSTALETSPAAGSVTLSITNHPMVVEVIGSGSGGTTAQSTAAFINSIGVNSHIGYAGTVYSNVPLELQELAYLGINHVREQAPDWALPSYQQMAAQGVKFNLVTSPGGQDLAATLAPDIASIVALSLSNPGSVVSVEGPNELNGGQWVLLNGCNSQAASCGAAMVQDVSQAVRLALPGVKVVNVSINNGGAGWLDYVAGLGNLGSYVDFANWHVYFNGQPPLTNITSMLANAQQSAPGKPVLFTETGYPTSPGDPYSVDTTTQANFILDVLADAFKTGVQTTYIYELMDGQTGSPQDPESNYGLFQTNGTPKPSGQAIHNLVQILGGGPVSASCTAAAAATPAAAPSTAVIPEQNTAVRWVSLPAPAPAPQQAAAPQSASQAGGFGQITQAGAPLPEQPPPVEIPAVDPATINPDVTQLGSIPTAPEPLPPNVVAASDPTIQDILAQAQENVRAALAESVAAMNQAQANLSQNAADVAAAQAEAAQK